MESDIVSPESLEQIGRNFAFAYPPGFELPTPEQIETGMRVANRKMVDEQIARAKRLEKARRSAKHRPGETKKTKAKRSAESRKRARGAKKSRAKNRRS